MPQISKGGKWVFGWCVIGASGEMRIPPKACTEYGFQPGVRVFFLRGSRRSGGFSVGRLEKLTGTDNPLMLRSLGLGVILDDGMVLIPPGIEFQPEERLLAVRGSGFAVVFLRQGPIFEAAREKLAWPD